MKHSLLSFVTFILLTGCSTITPQVNEYTILPSPLVPHSSAPISSKTLGIAPIKTISSLGSKNLSYIRENGEAGAYLYARWNETPANMLLRSLTLSLSNAQIFASLQPSMSSAQADWVLESDLHAFYHRFLPNGESEGYIDITYRLIDLRTKRILSTKRFDITSKSPSQDSVGGVAALSNATSILDERCVQWLKITAQENQ